MSKSERPIKNHVFMILAEVFFTTSIFCLGFVIYSLLWTDVKADKEMKEAVDTFQEENPVVVITPVPEESDKRHYENIPVYPVPSHGEIFGVLYVPRWDFMKIPIAEGTTDDVLIHGYAGHYVETEDIGVRGNFALAAHRRTKGSNFRAIDDLVNGDRVVIETSDAYIVYEMYDHKIVDPKQEASLAAFNVVPWSDQEYTNDYYLTLTTCNPEYGNTERYVVNLKFVYWIYKSDGVPEEIEGHVS